MASSSSTPPKSKIFPHFPSLFRTFSPFLFAFFLIAASSAAANSPSTIYDYLRLHGLPIGLLPKGITEFSQDPSTGFFQVMLNKPCNAKFENQVHYDFNVTGTLTFGRIGNLSGVSAQELFLWFPVKGIRVDVPSSGLIYFDVGVVDKQFSLSLFESPPDCTADPPSNAAGFENFQIDDLKSGSQNGFQKLRREVGQRSALRATS
ncbi:hypothetical protein UlMin_029865 [Ulmus minor]